MISFNNLFNIPSLSQEEFMSLINFKNVAYVENPAPIHSLTKTADPQFSFKLLKLIRLLKENSKPVYFEAIINWQEIYNRINTLNLEASIINGFHYWNPHESDSFFSNISYDNKLITLNTLYPDVMDEYWKNRNLKFLIESKFSEKMREVYSSQSSLIDVLIEDQYGDTENTQIRFSAKTFINSENLEKSFLFIPWQHHPLDFKNKTYNIKIEETLVSHNDYLPPRASLSIKLNESVIVDWDLKVQGISKKIKISQKKY